MSSSPLYTTIERPIIDCGPINLTNWSVILTLALPSEPTVIFPKLPTCLVSSSGAPCVLPNGLKCGPKDGYPCDKLPKT